VSPARHGCACAGHLPDDDGRRLFAEIVLGEADNRLPLVSVPAAATTVIVGLRDKRMRERDEGEQEALFEEERRWAGCRPGAGFRAFEEWPPWAGCAHERQSPSRHIGLPASPPTGLWTTGDALCVWLDADQPAAAAGRLSCCAC
jgi:hypothetical protein